MLHKQSLIFKSCGSIQIVLAHPVVIYNFQFYIGKEIYGYYLAYIKFYPMGYMHLVVVVLYPHNTFFVQHILATYAYVVPLHL